jgi:hypothetical protein
LTTPTCWCCDEVARIAATTVCCAWRWRIVARGLGVELPLGTAVAWERSAGQLVQVGLTVAVLLVLPSPVRAAMPLVAVALLVAAVGVVAIARMPFARDRSRRGGCATPLGASLGVATAVVYGVMVFAASLPGAAVLVVDWVRRTRSAPWLEQPAGRVLRVPARPEAAPDA